MDYVPPKFNKYFKQVRERTMGGPCTAPSGIENGGGIACIEGDTIDSDGICTPQCAKGFSATEVELWCHLGALEPATFECREGLTASVEDCVFESKGDVDKVKECLAKSAHPQRV